MPSETSEIHTKGWESLCLSDMCWQAAGRAVSARNTGWCTVSWMKPLISSRLDTITEEGHYLGYLDIPKSAPMWLEAGLNPD
jgi:hypothetical protein